MSWDSMAMAALMMSEWIADADGVSHYATKARTQDTAPSYDSESGMPHMVVAVQTACGRNFSVEVKAGTSRCATCAKAQGEALPASKPRLP